MAALDSAAILRLIETMSELRAASAEQTKLLLRLVEAVEGGAGFGGSDEDDEDDEDDDEDDADEDADLIDPILRKVGHQVANGLKTKKAAPPGAAPKEG